MFIVRYIKRFIIKTEWKNEMKTVWKADKMHKTQSYRVIVLQWSNDDDDDTGDDDDDDDDNSNKNDSSNNNYEKIVEKFNSETCMM